ncbi:TDT family transporter [Streptomyces sp. NPDC005953]|uniref:TDT family transporter n=1 Tax=Streptomyces sp. NPDC005953 TaxID=3156719 RepID=UPI0033F9F2D8
MALAPPVPAPVSVPLPLLRHFTPNWYATVMGTAIVANAGAALDIPGTRPLLTAVWALSAVLLIAVVIARLLHWRHHRDRARAHLLDPTIAPFYGCAAMATLAVGAGTLPLGAPLMGAATAVPVAVLLLVLGTVAAVGTASVIPWLMVVNRRIEPGSASPVWLLPVVPPMVAAASWPPLIPELPAGQWPTAVLLASAAMFGLSLLATLAVLPLVIARLLRHGPLPLALTPALFLVLGPLGQSTTAADAMAYASRSVFPALQPSTVSAFATGYGVVAMGLAVLWLTLAGAATVRAMRRGLPFTLGWWAFTFPVGTCVTGAAALGERTELTALTLLAGGLYVLLVTAWAVAAGRTVRGLFSAELLAAPRPAPRAPSPGTARTR